MSFGRVWKWASCDDVAQFAAKIVLPRAFWKQKWSGARVLERRGGFRALTSRILGLGRRNGPGVWDAGLFDFLALRALTSLLLVLWSGVLLIAKVIYLS